MNVRLQLLCSATCLALLTGCSSQAQRQAEPAPVTPATTAQCPQTVTPECPKPVPVKADMNDKITIGEVESILLTPPGTVLLARIDTGATTTSVNALEIQPFERDGESWVKFVLPDDSGQSHTLERPVTRTVFIKRHGAESIRRQVVSMALELGGKSLKSEVTLTDRSSFTYKLLIGRNFLKDTFVVDVSEKNLHKPSKPAAKK